MATCNYADPYVQEDSDQERGNDSDDEITQWVDGTPQQKRHIRRRSIGLPSDSSEDEFEKEMMSDLNEQMTTNYPLGQVAAQSRKDKEEADNDALFYDPSMDDDDERWVKKQRDLYKPTSKLASSAAASTSQAKTDAVLNCPACMCTVCLDCQRHSVYDTQYRAMFALNTLVNYGETLQLKEKQERNLKNKRKRKHNAAAPAPVDTCSDYNDMVAVDQATMDTGDETNFYHPVNCSNCNTRIAVYDSEEVYHFFNVLSSYS